MSNSSKMLKSMVGFRGMEKLGVGVLEVLRQYWRVKHLKLRFWSVIYGSESLN